jgi:hypothetical protein
MNPNIMADDIINKMQSNQINDSTDANKYLQLAIKEHIESNCTPIYSWVGMLPPPTSTPDPVVSFSCTVTGVDPIPIDYTGCNDAASALLKLATSLSSWISMFTINPQPGFVLSPLNLMCPTIILVPSMATDQRTSLIILCTSIISSIIGGTPTASGVHAAYSGTATFTSFT